MPYTYTYPQAQWLNALESGDYPQAGGWLKTENGYCCLGVACELNGWETDADARGELGLPSTALDYHSESRLLKLRFSNGGIHTEDGARLYTRDNTQDWVWIYPDQEKTLSFEWTACESLVSLNDTLGITFKNIAKIIRSKPEAFFE